MPIIEIAVHRPIGAMEFYGTSDGNLCSGHCNQRFTCSIPAYRVEHPIRADMWRMDRYTVPRLRLAARLCEYIAHLHRHTIAYEGAR